MGKLIDISGKTFGKLKVIERVEDAVSPSGGRQPQWLCKCQCGNVVKVLGCHLRKGHTTSCGCYITERLFIDLKGKRFGRLVVIKELGRKWGQVVWKCLCDCGNHANVTSYELRTGDTQSCGCLQKERTSESSVIDLTGRRFGRLQVIKQSGRKDKKVLWKCLCDCGKETVVGSSLLISGKTKSCGCYNLERVSESHFVNIGGKRFGILNVIELDHMDREYGAIWKCECDCGKVICVRGDNLRSGNTTSCGCTKESSVATNVKNYFSEKYGGIPEYKMFKNPENGYWLKCDVFIPVKNVYIEINGNQHYEFVEYFHKTIENFKRRKLLNSIKEKIAKKDGTYIEIDLRKIKTSQAAIDYIEERLEKLPSN